MTRLDCSALCRPEHRASRPRRFVAPMTTSSSATSCAALPASTSPSTSARRWSAGCAPSSPTRASEADRRAPSGCAPTPPSSRSCSTGSRSTSRSCGATPSSGTLLEKRAAARAGRPPGQIRAWSAGCSYGAEAYTLATLCQRAIPDERGARSSGTDIDKRMVERATARRCSATTTRARAPEQQLKRWLRARRRRLARQARAAHDDPLRGRRPAADAAAPRRLST